MAHFAEIDENNIVQQVIVVHNNEVEDEEGNDEEGEEGEEAPDVNGNSQLNKTDGSSSRRGGAFSRKAVGSRTPVNHLCLTGLESSSTHSAYARHNPTSRHNSKHAEHVLEDQE